MVLTAAGHPPPASYSSGGKSVSWTEYLSMAIDKLKELETLITAAGADGGIVEIDQRMYT